MDKYLFYRQISVRRGSTFTWCEQLLCTLERCRRKFSAHGVLLLVLGHSLLSLKEACGLKTQPTVSPFLKMIPWHWWTAACRANHIILCAPIWSHDVLHHHTPTLVFLFEGKRDPSAVCKPQHHLPLPHKPQIKGLHFLNHRGVPGAPRSRCLAVYFLLDNKTVQPLQYVVEGKTFPIRYPTYISKRYKNTQPLTSACRRHKNWGEQVKIVTQS